MAVSEERLLLLSREAVVNEYTMNGMLVANVTHYAHFTEVTATFAKYFDSEDYLDITFVCANNHLIKAHKLVLVSVSPFLKEVLKDSEKCQSDIYISVPDISHKSLSQVLNLLYYGRAYMTLEEHASFKDTLDMLQIQAENVGVVMTSLDSLQPLPRLMTPDKRRRRNQQGNVESVSCETLHYVPNTVNSEEDEEPIIEMNDAEESSAVNKTVSENDPLNVPDFYYMPTAPLPAPKKPSESDHTPDQQPKEAEKGTRVSKSATTPNTSQQNGNADPRSSTTKKQQSSEQGTLKRKGKTSSDSRSSKKTRHPESKKRHPESSEKSLERRINQLATKNDRVLRALKSPSRVKSTSQDGEKLSVKLRERPVKSNERPAAVDDKIRLSPSSERPPPEGGGEKLPPKSTSKSSSKTTEKSSSKIKLDKTKHKASLSNLSTPPKNPPDSAKVEKFHSKAKSTDDIPKMHREEKLSIPAALDSPAPVQDRLAPSSAGADTLSDDPIGWLYKLKKEDLIEQLQQFDLDITGPISVLRARLSHYLQHELQTVPDPVVSAPPPQSTPTSIALNHISSPKQDGISAEAKKRKMATMDLAKHLKQPRVIVRDVMNDLNLNEKAGTLTLSSSLRSPSKPNSSSESGPGVKSEISPRQNVNSERQLDFSGQQ